MEQQQQQQQQQASSGSKSSSSADVRKRPAARLLSSLKTFAQLKYQYPETWGDTIQRAFLPGRDRQIYGRALATPGGRGMGSYPPFWPQWFAADPPFTYVKRGSNVLSVCPLGNMRPGLGDQGESGIVTVTDAFGGRPPPLPKLRTPVVPVEAGVGAIPLFVDLTGQLMGELSVEKDEEEMMGTRSGAVHGESTEIIRAYNIDSDLVRALVGRMRSFYESNPELAFEGFTVVRVQDLPMALTDSGQQLTLQHGLEAGEWSWDAIENAYGAKALSEANLRRLASLKDAEGKTSGGVSALRESYYAPDRVFATLLVAMGRTPLEGNGFAGLTMDIGGQAVPCLVVGYSHCALFQGPGEGSFGAECALGYTSTSTTQLTAVWPVSLSKVQTGKFWAMGEGAPADVGATSPRSYATAAAAADAALADAAASGSGMGGTKFAGGRRKRKRVRRRRRTRRRGNKTRKRRKRRKKGRKKGTRRHGRRSRKVY